MKKLLRGSVVLIGLLAAPAYAADVPAKPVYKAAPALSAVPYTWTGFYLGGHGGGGWARESFDHPFDPFPFAASAANIPVPLFTGIRGNGAVFGGQFGFNLQLYASWVVGLEADISGTTIKQSETHANSITFQFAGTGIQTRTSTGTVEGKIRDLVTLRGKIGFLPWNNILLYGTGGLAWGQVAQTAGGTLDIECVPDICGPPSVRIFAAQTFSKTTTQFGWTAGVGADWKIWNNLILGLLYLHYDLGNTTLQCNDAFFCGDSPQFTRSHVTADVITARLSWLFTLVPAPVVARY
jgi:outer membrane immunogenic protein